MRRNAFRFVLAAAAVPFLTGCPSFATLKTARALDPGEFEVTAATEILGMTAPASQGGGVRPGLILAARYGVVPGLDVGAHLDPVAGVAGDATIQLVRGKAVDLSLGPGAGYFQTPGPVSYGAVSIGKLGLDPMYTIASATLPVLVGFNFGDGHQVVVAPRATAYVVEADSNGPGGVEAFLGGSLGVSLKLSRAIRVMPEVNVTAPVAWTGRGDAACTPTQGDCSPFERSAVIVQGGLAVSFTGTSKLLEP